MYSTPPLGGSPWDYCLPVWFGKTRMIGLPDGKKIRRYVYPFWQNVRTWQTDRHRMTAKAVLDASIARQKSSQSVKPCIQGWGLVKRLHYSRPIKGRQPKDNIGCIRSKHALYFGGQGSPSTDLLRAKTMGCTVSMYGQLQRWWLHIGSLLCSCCNCSLSLHPRCTYLFVFCKPQSCPLEYAYILM